MEIIVAIILSVPILIAIAVALLVISNVIDYWKFKRVVKKAERERQEYLDSLPKPGELADYFNSYDDVPGDEENDNVPKF